VPVKTGAEGLDGRVQILEGLTPGDEVVVYSERELEDGSRIQVVGALRGATQ
jgi:HlyD family secretion protein